MTGNAEDFILTEIVDDHVLVITLNRPKVRNAFNGAMAQRMEDVVDEFEANHELRAALLTANGPTFSAGQDLKSAQSGDLGVTEKRGPFGFMRKTPEKPVVAAVDGQAFAGGMELILSCDMIVASETSEFALTESKRALLAGGGGCFRLPERIPYCIAMEMILIGDPKSAQEMLQHGLLNRVVAPGKAFDAGLEMAKRIAANSPVAVAAAKAVASRSQKECWTEQESFENQMPYVRKTMDSEDMQEGIQAFLDKRAPVWKGK